jgi:hypothetical protein
MPKQGSDRVPSLRIDERFRGPPESGNGGYVAGLLARALGGSDIEVTLRVPPPLGRALELRIADSEAELGDGDELIASAIPAAVEIVPPPAPTLAAARASSRGFTGFAKHIFPGCFVCGPERSTGDGLCIFPGPVEGTNGVVSSEWIATPDLSEQQDRVAPEFIWASLDCPGYFAVQQTAGLAVLGRLAVRLIADVPVGKPLIVTGWGIESAGRKHKVGTALYDEAGQALAVAVATWISLKR